MTGRTRSAKNSEPKVPAIGQRSSARIRTRKLQETNSSIDQPSNSEFSDSGPELGLKKRSRPRKVTKKAESESKAKRTVKKVQSKSQDNVEGKKDLSKACKKPVRRKKEPNRNHQDNLMDSTPLKNRRTFRIPSVSLDTDSEDDCMDSPTLTTKQRKETSTKAFSQKQQSRTNGSSVPRTPAAVTLSNSRKKMPVLVSSGKIVRFQGQIIEKQTECLAGKGTLKRKKQIRQYLENLDQGHQDNILESTPFRDRKRIKLPDILSESDDEFTEYSVTNTPLPKTPVNQYRPCGPLGADLTPTVDSPSAGILQERNRDDMEYYVWKIQQRRKRGKYKPAVPNNAKPTNKSVLSAYTGDIATPTNLQELFSAEAPADLYIDSDEGEDDYFMTET